jgi:hypothetical protein
MYVCIRIYVYIHICTRIYIHVYICVCVCVYVFKQPRTRESHHHPLGSSVRGINSQKKSSEKKKKSTSTTWILRARHKFSKVLISSDLPGTNTLALTFENFVSPPPLAAHPELMQFFLFFLIAVRGRSWRHTPSSTPEIASR